MTKAELMKFFHDIGIVPVVKIDDAEKAVPLAKAMIKGGLPVAEITFRTAAAEEAIKRVTKECPEMVVGAGTVINPEIAKKAVAAGAQFIVSAGLNPETVKWCNENNIPVVPGVCTPSEIEQGLALGLDTLKFFPAEASGGVGMLKNFAGPFSQVKFMTTGGINASNVTDYAKCGNVITIGGSWMVKADLIENENWDEITRLCAEALKAVQGLEFVHVGINNADEAELMHKPFYGTKGHLAFRCIDLERTVYYLSKFGFTVKEESVKYDAKGKMKVCYFNEEIGGFAIHLVK